MIVLHIDTLRSDAVSRPTVLPGCLPGSTRWERAELGLSILSIGKLRRHGASHRSGRAPNYVVRASFPQFAGPAMSARPCSLTR